MWQEILPGETKKLAIVDQQRYYLSATEGRGTSRQYYLNPKGYPANEACRWGNSTEAIGNWAPVNLGIGWDSNVGLGYFSMFNNAPTQTNATLGYNVEVTGGREPCVYDNNQKQIIFDNRIRTPAAGPTPLGCTVSVAPKSRVVYSLTPA
jgi:SUN family beta-glucosidase